MKASETESAIGVRFVFSKNEASDLRKVAKAKGKKAEKAE